MRRVRIAFALLSLALAAGATLLVGHAMASLRAERAAQAETLAARIFDEMERELSAFLAAEEEAPVSDWRARLAGGPQFVRARFEISGEGEVGVSADEPADLREQLAAWADRRVTRPLRRESPSTPPRDALAETPSPSRLAKEEKETVYEALQSLNRGAEERVQRARKIVPGEGRVESSLADADRIDTQAQPDALAAPAAVEPSRSSAAAPGVAPAPLSQEASDTARLGASSTGSRTGSTNAAKRSAAIVDPLLGDRLDRATLLLVRTVLVDGRGLRQGLVLDEPALGGWLAERVGSRSGIPGLEIRIGNAEDTLGTAYEHRFAEPFEALRAGLRLPALDGGAGAAAILLLSGLLATVAAVALFALYRMVAVALRFAERRSNFVAAVSHELKTPLTSIRMYAEMLRDGLAPSEEKRHEYARTITAESERLSRLIDNVLEFAASERGGRRAELAHGSLTGEIEAIAEMLGPHARGAGFTLLLSVEPALPAVRYDRDALAQILVNLVDNAQKYARSAIDRRLELRVARSAEGVIVALRDHGPGVAAGDLSRVFELFHRGGDELTRATKGTGLGLALVRSLAERMGASASARNVEGGGFEVSIVFPVIARERAAPTALTPPDETAERDEA